VAAPKQEGGPELLTDFERDIERLTTKLIGRERVFAEIDRWLAPIYAP